jgi:hypothetical protein
VQRAIRRIKANRPANFPHSWGPARLLNGPRDKKKSIQLTRRQRRKRGGESGRQTNHQRYRGLGRTPVERVSQLRINVFPKIGRTSCIDCITFVPGRFDPGSVASFLLGDKAENLLAYDACRRLLPRPGNIPENRIPIPSRRNKSEGVTQYGIF